MMDLLNCRLLSFAVELDSLCTMMTLLIITIQNTVGRYKEWNLAKNVQINLPEINGQNEELGPRGFNTNKYDV